MSAFSSLVSAEVCTAAEAAAGAPPTDVTVGTAGVSLSAGVLLSAGLALATVATAAAGMANGSGGGCSSNAPLTLID